MAGGRPSDFTPEMANTICEELIEGNSLRSICRSEDMPSASTVCRWLSQHVEFREQYAHAREAQADTLTDEIVDIADGRDKPTQEELEAAAASSIVTVRDPARDRLRVDARKWYASKLAPKRYGDKLAIGGDDELGPVRHTVEWLPSE